MSFKRYEKKLKLHTYLNFVLKIQIPQLKSNSFKYERYKIQLFGLQGRYIIVSLNLC